MESGYLALVLHAHLPYAGSGEVEDALAQHWLFEAMTESYIPLLLALEGLAGEGVPFRLTFSVSPTLVTMLLDPLLQARYEKRLEQLIELAGREMARTADRPEVNVLATMYRRLLLEAHEAFATRFRRDLVGAWKRLQEEGYIEILAGAATHGYLPLLRVVPSAAETQIRVGVDEYERAFGRQPRGFWLPECAFYPGVDRMLGRHGIRHTFLETHGITRADPRPRFGVYAPLYCPSGVAVFGRDPLSSRQVWSSTEGYPGDPDYREFYRDLAHDLDHDEVRAYMLHKAMRLDTGLKYYRVTGDTDQKELYVPELARRKAELDAEDFLTNKRMQTEALAGLMDRSPIVSAAFDAELFGHWWFEGPRFIEALIRKASQDEAIRLTTLSGYLQAHSDNQVASPATSSWGRNGFHEVWLNERNDWIYPLLHRAATREEALLRLTDLSGATARARAQARRELLLAQASDWAFMLDGGGLARYAEERIRGHLDRFDRLADQVEQGAVDEAWLTAVERRDRLFPSLEVDEARTPTVPAPVLRVEQEAGVTRAAPAATPPVSRLSGDDLHLFNEGTHFQLQDKLGAHVMNVDGVEGTYFAVWAPQAASVAVVGDFNDWDAKADLLAPRDLSGIWEGFVAGAGGGDRYKFHVDGHGGHRAEKADPVATFAEVPPGTASLIWDLAYAWGDADWMAARAKRNALDAPLSIYEVHLGSWRRVAEEGNRPLTYQELAPQLAEYATEQGFTHVELLPVMEHPFYGSWGYQVTGYFAPTSRYGTPQDLMALIDRLHQAGVGVILDWVPSHFPTDEHALGYFDGTHLYEHADPRLGHHPEWGTFIFNYGRPEVRSFLISNAVFWLSRYHADGMRVDAVASMLYLDYARADGEWIPNRYGGRENLEAIDFLRQLNEEVYRRHPDVMMIAEESTAWPMVSRPTDTGGLGFGLKWDMGWMHDTLRYMSRDPILRRYHHNDLTFRALYAFHENFVLPLSHDEVVHGKGSLLGRMPGDEWQRYANLRLLFGFMYAQAGKKMLFMGGELAQVPEWSHEAGLEWNVLVHSRHAGVQRLVRDLNRLYAAEPALHELDCEPAGFEWVEADDAQTSIIGFLRRGRSTDDLVLVVANFTPVPRLAYRMGVPRGGVWREVLNSDAPTFGGSGMGNGAGVEALPQPAHGRPYSLELTLPPLACVFLKGPTHRARGPLLLGREGDAAIKAGDRPRILPERTRKIAPRSAHECRKTRWIES